MSAKVIVEPSGLPPGHSMRGGILYKNGVEVAWQAFLDWGKKSGWQQERIAEEIVTNRAHLNQVLNGKRTGGQTWRRIVKALPMEGLLLLQQCAAWNKFAEKALEKRRADEADTARLLEMGKRARETMEATP